MTYFPDLSAYTYSKVLDDGEQTLCVGWLDAEHTFPTGDTPREFRDALRSLCVEKQVAKSRGFHRCNLTTHCRDLPNWPPMSVAVGDKQIPLGSAEIRVPDDGIVYAAPDLIIHYVVDHRYRPPDEFMAAVRRST